IQPFQTSANAGDGLLPRLGVLPRKAFGMAQDDAIFPRSLLAAQVPGKGGANARYGKPVKKWQSLVHDGPADASGLAARMKIDLAASVADAAGVNESPIDQSACFAQTTELEELPVHRFASHSSCSC